MAIDALYCGCFAAIFISFFCCSVESTEEALDIIKVLNTTQPLFVYYVGRAISGVNCDQKCNKTTLTCQYIRTTEISNTSVQYNESSSLVGSNWTNVYRANFSTKATPPVEMEYERVSPPEKSKDKFFMRLNYTTPRTYNCSVFIAALRGQDYLVSSMCIARVAGVKIKVTGPTTCSCQFTVPPVCLVPHSVNALQERVEPAATSLQQYAC
ncbi:uncharacterized protein LOC125939924 [Dermacentor silvarum]|uniref:uncharacterized protein LOC125939924 n=1 Tax=Dermacentor silvarum TaxID=543639 RepID=UPI002100A7D7|nr:uncharacterized protein LOC125939924 [Dermacentor silvarum]